MRQLLVGALLVSATAVAGPKDPKLAHQKLVAAEEAEHKGDADAARGHAADAKAQWTAAETAYRQALDASDDVTIDYSLAIVEDKLGHPADAYKHLQIVARADVKPDLMKKVQTKIDDVASRIGIVKLTVRPDGTQVSVGGNVVGTTPLADPLVLAPGTYTINLTAQGYQPKNVELKVLAGSEIERKDKLDAVPVAIATKIQEPPAAPPPAKRVSYVPLIVGGTVTFGLIVTATFTGIAAIHQHDIYVDPATDETDRKQAQSTGRLEAHLTDGFIVGAVAAAAATASWYYYQKVTSATESPSKVAVAPWVQPDASGLVVAGSF
ncbi:MAG TPA: PEGA domain-containing protein [Kofleriaceae bacterium]|jgi:hypothetical protein